MLFGHIGVGLLAKRVAPDVPLGVSLVSVTALDVLCGAFVASGLETVDGVTGDISIPYSHGLLMSVVWTAAAATLSYLILRDRRKAILIGLLVFSHWVLDFISHPMGMGQKLPPDLPLLFEGSPRVGLGLYNSLPAAIITDFGLFIAGIVVYLLFTHATSRMGNISFWLMIAFILSTIVPAASPQLSSYATFLFVLLLPIGNWVDSHRRLKVGSISQAV